MNKKFIGVVYASMAMLSVGIMVIVGMISGSWDNLWLFPFGAMILATVFAMVVGAMDDKKSDKKK
ncbi:MAG: hypothetical protein Q4F58_02810 [Candidatus Saccharibacteria bacterium]|nr:hypothetical protein [Candidatus Saccharibacteria bacterium]